MDIITYDGEKWGTNIKGSGKASCNGFLSVAIGSLITTYGLIVDKEHPLTFNANHEAWNIERSEENVYQ